MAENIRKYMRIPPPSNHPPLLFYFKNKHGQDEEVYALLLNESYEGKAIVVSHQSVVREGEFLTWVENEHVSSIWKVAFASQIDLGVWRLGITLVD